MWRKSRKMYLMLFNFMIDGETRKFIRFMTHVWTILIIGFLTLYLRTFISYIISAEPLPTDIIFFAIVGLLFPAIGAFLIKFLVIRLLGRGTFEKPAKPDEKNDEKKH